MIRKFAIILIFLIPKITLADAATSANFTVHTTDDNATVYCNQFEISRKAHYKNYFNQDIGDWNAKVPVEIKVDKSSGGGYTEFNRGEISCYVSGNKDALLKDVIPHETFHMVVHTYFRTDFLPRWWDEGIASSCESQSYQVGKYDLYLYNKKTGYDTQRLWGMAKYPEDIMLFYGQSHSQIKYLESLKGKIALINFMIDYLKVGPDQALKDNYGINSVADFQNDWLAWIPSYRKTCDVSWNPQTGQWECPPVRGLINVVVGPKNNSTAPPTINPQGDGATPGPITPVQPQSTTPAPVPPTPQPIDVTPFTKAVSDLTTLLNQQLQANKNAIESFGEKFGQSQASADANFTRLSTLLSKIADINQKIATSPITPVVEQTASWILPAILGASGVGGLSGLALLLTKIFGAKAKLPIPLNGLDPAILNQIIQQKSGTNPNNEILQQLLNIIAQQKQISSSATVPGATVVVPSPPQMQTSYVPVATDTPELVALKKAMDELVRRNPGSKTFVTQMQAFADQYLSGNPQGAL